jgi:hypothetical protein
MGKFIDYVFNNVFEPFLGFVLNHPIVSVVVLGAMIFFAVRNYRML